MDVVRTSVVALSLLASSSSVCGQQNHAGTVAADPKLDLQHVLIRLEERNAERSAALEQFEGTRVYRMDYHGFPSDRDAEMVVKVSFRAPNFKEFSVVSETGSKFVIDHIFKKLLEGEQEASKGDNRQDTALTRKNYDFAIVGYENAPEGPQYVLSLTPKSRNKFLYRGKIWVDARDFAVVRIEGEPGKNPSMWIKKTQIAHRYKKVGGFWLPAENHTESFIRLGGKATLSIEYRDYKIIKVAPAVAGIIPLATADSALDGMAVGDGATWATQIGRRGTR